MKQSHHQAYVQEPSKWLQEENNDKMDIFLSEHRYLNLHLFRSPTSVYIHFHLHNQDNIRYRYSSSSQIVFLNVFVLLCSNYILKGNEYIVTNLLPVTIIRLHDHITCSVIKKLHHV